MWSDFSGKDYDANALAKRIGSLKWTKWKPRGIVLHNTASPTLAQWAESGPSHDQRIKNLQSYYEGMGWHGGPHWFVSRSRWTEFSNPLRQGTHSPSFNKTHFGIEMVGDYNSEAFNSGDGARVRDNAVYLMALLCKKFGWDPAKVIRFHKEDPRTTHDCPGRNVKKPDIVARVKAAMAGTVVVEQPKRFSVLATEFGGINDKQDSAYGGKVNGNALEGSLPARLPSNRRTIRVFHNGLSAVVKINDVGPYNKTDNYWDKDTRPRVEQQYRSKTRAENGMVPVAAAALDLTPPVFDTLKIPGKRENRQAVVEFEFVGAEVVPSAPPQRPASRGGVVAAIGTAALAAGGFLSWLDAHYYVVVGGVVFTVAVAIGGWVLWKNRNKQ